jgi:hypothetical protein
VNDHTDHLWTDADVARFFRIAPDAVDVVIAAGLPALDVPAVGRRFRPEVVRLWATGSGATFGDQLTRPRGPTHTRPRFGSGFTRSREDA